MSKIGKMPINIGDATIELKGNTVFYKGKNAEGSHVIPDFLSINLENKLLKIDMPHFKKHLKKDWGLHRALLSNKISGANNLFEKKILIVGLGFKVQLNDNNMIFSLGFSHKINLELPKAVFLQVDKSGQKLTFSSANKELLGLTCDTVRSLRPPEPYKGTGIRLENEVIIRKAGKTKSS